MKTEDNDKLFALASKAENLRTYEEPLGADLGEFADGAIELITELYARLAVLEGNWNPAKAKTRMKRKSALQAPAGPAPSFLKALADKDGFALYVDGMQLGLEFQKTREGGWIYGTMLLLWCMNGGKRPQSHNGTDAIVNALVDWTRSNADYLYLQDWHKGGGFLYSYGWGVEHKDEIAKATGLNKGVVPPKYAALLHWLVKTRTGKSRNLAKLFEDRQISKGFLDSLAPAKDAFSLGLQSQGTQRQYVEFLVKKAIDYAKSKL